MSIYAVHADVTDFAAHHQLAVIRHHRCRRDDGAAQLVANRLHIGEINEIRLHLGVVLTARFIVGPNQIRADAADLIENQILADKRNRDDKND
jgi:hypothetical protein